MDKAEIRKIVLEGRAALTEEEIQLASQVICRKVMMTETYEQAENICLYHPIRKEVDVMLLAETAAEDGKKVWLPKTFGEDMKFMAYEGEDKLEMGAFRVMEPTSETELAADDKTLVIMPGAAFTGFRERIGYGAGYYDKYLAEHPQCRTIAVCYDIQIVDEIPAEDHDIRPDYVICESAIYR